MMPYNNILYQNVTLKVDTIVILIYNLIVQMLNIRGFAVISGGVSARPDVTDGHS